MTFDEWRSAVPQVLTDDPLWRMEVYQLAVFAGDLTWHDISKLVKDKRTVSLADQLYRAVGSIGANIAEGYSRQSGKDQARFYEYALGSSREARLWYHYARQVLTEPVTIHRMNLLTSIIRSLLTIIPAERGYKLREEQPIYAIDNDPGLDNPPGL
jgi:four helix bundle protein